MKESLEQLVNCLGYTFASLLLLGSCGDGREIPNVTVNLDELAHDVRGFYYYNDTLFSGIAIDYFADQKIKSTSPYFQGKLEGDMVGFYFNGDTAYVRPYHLGEKHGYHLGYYPEGQKKFKYYFENGLSEGNHQYWYPDGQLKKDLNYVDGRELGSQKVWRPDGKMRSNYVVRENGRKYGILGLKRCTKIDSKTKNLDPYRSQMDN